MMIMMIMIRRSWPGRRSARRKRGSFGFFRISTSKCSNAKWRNKRRPRRIKGSWRSMRYVVVDGGK